MLQSACCVAVGLLLARSSVVKLRRLDEFSTIVRQYPVVGIFAGETAAVMVAAVEGVSSAALLMVGVTQSPLAIVPAMGFLAVATVAVLWRHWHGERRFACGCSDHLSEQVQSSVMLWRNTVLLAVLASALGAGTRRATWHVYALAVALLLAYELVDAAIMQEGRVRSWTAQS